MEINKYIACGSFPCKDVNHNLYCVPELDVEVDKIKLVLISEAAPGDPNDYYYAKGNPSFERTTITAFNDAGIEVKSIHDILDLGIYLTTAVKCGKTTYGIKSDTIKECSLLLEKEISLLPTVKVYLLMGDVAIKAFNQIALSKGTGKVIPAGSTYKIREQEYYFQDARVFPSYLQVGPSFNIEKSKRRMIAEDISRAMELLN